MICNHSQTTAPNPDSLLLSCKHDKLRRPHVNWNTTTSPSSKVGPRLKRRVNLGKHTTLAVRCTDQRHVQADSRSTGMLYIGSLWSKNGYCQQNLPIKGLVLSEKFLSWEAPELANWDNSAVQGSGPWVTESQLFLLQRVSLPFLK